MVCGPQEGDQINNFYESLSLQIERASVAGYPILMVGDFDAKLGKGIIKDDIHDMCGVLESLPEQIIRL